MSTFFVLFVLLTLSFTVIKIDGGGITSSLASADRDRQDEQQDEDDLTATYINPKEKRGDGFGKRVLATGMTAGLLMTAGAAATMAIGNDSHQVGAVQRVEGLWHPASPQWAADFVGRRSLMAKFDDEHGPTAMVPTSADDLQEQVSSDDDIGPEPYSYEPDIMHGHPIPSIQYMPFMASVWNGRELLCTSTVIGPQHILLAAHCFYFLNSSSPLPTVLAGTLNATLDPHNGQQRKVIGWQPFDKESFMNMDIAIAQVDKPFDESVKPVILSHKMNSTTGKGFIAGWGVSGKHLEMPTMLLGANVTIWGRDRCRAAMSREICAFGKDGANICYGDSGGPLLIKNEQTKNWEQIGITHAGGNGHCHHGGIFTGVSFYCKWIDNQTKGQVKCAN